MKCKVVLGVLVAVVGILALSATAAQAGAGGSPTTLTGFFVCHNIDGDDPGRTFDLASAFGPFDSSGNPILQSVKIGKGSLACAFARLFYPQPKGAPAQDPIEVEPGIAEQMTCYPLSKSNKDKVNPPPDYLVFDPLFTDPLTIAVPPTRLEYLCAPSGYFAQ